LADAPRTDPYAKNYFIRLLPRVVHAKPLVWVRVLSIPFPNRCLSYPVQSVQCFLLSLWTGRSRPARIPLGHRPFLRNLRHDMGNMPLCSAPSSVLRRCQTAQQRPCKDYRHRPSLTVPPSNTAEAAELSRFSNIERLRMLRVSDSAGPVRDWLYRAATRGAFPTVGRGRRPEGVISEINGWPTLPLSTLHVQSHDRPRMTRGHNGAAPPFMWGTFTPCSMPVYPGAFPTLYIVLGGG